MENQKEAQVCAAVYQHSGSTSTNVDAVPSGGS